EQQEREFQQLLSTEELAEYKLRSSTSADVRSRLTGFDASEAELKELVRIQEKFSATAAGNPKLPGPQTAQAEIKTLLGEQRFTEYQRAQDGRYQELYQLAERFSLPAQVAAEAYEVRKVAEDQAGR